MESAIKAKTAETRISVGFPPVARSDARVLILGSLPSERSLAKRQYYAHPQNAFWPIMHELVGATGSYAQRCECLIAAGIALWDVLCRSVRPGSMDADIQLNTSEVNDFEGFISNHRNIGLICFNGKKAEQMFHKFVEQETIRAQLRFETLPSTSPAYASMSFADKLNKWRVITT
jgi:hypoxanthine-DNA glycosylase